MRGLTLFLEKLVSNPYLKSDHSVYSFFTESSPEQWENYKKQSMFYYDWSRNYFIVTPCVPFSDTV